MVDFSYTDTENAFQTLAKVLLWLLPPLVEPFCFVWKGLRPIGYLVSYALTLSSLITLILPSFFTLLIVRTTKTEIESKVSDWINKRKNDVLSSLVAFIYNPTQLGGGWWYTSQSTDLIGTPFYPALDSRKSSLYLSQHRRTLVYVKQRSLKRNLSNPSYGGSVLLSDQLP